MERSSVILFLLIDGRRHLGKKRKKTADDGFQRKRGKAELGGERNRRVNRNIKIKSIVV